MDQQQKNDKTEKIRGLGRKEEVDWKEQLNNSPKIPDGGVWGGVCVCGAGGRGR